MAHVTADIELPERYLHARHLASGGMAAVFAAEDVTLGRAVAVKVLSERFLTDRDAVRRFEREARAAAKASQHPHVVTIYDIGEHDVLGGEKRRHAAARQMARVEVALGELDRGGDRRHFGRLPGPPRLYSPAHGEDLSFLRQETGLRPQPQPFDGGDQAPLRPEPPAGPHR